MRPVNHLFETPAVSDVIIFQMHTRMRVFSVNSITQLHPAVILNATIVSLLLLYIICQQF